LEQQVFITSVLDCTSKLWNADSCGLTLHKNK
jgi:hypothetical protein